MAENPPPDDYIPGGLSEPTPPKDIHEQVRDLVNASQDAGHLDKSPEQNVQLSLEERTDMEMQGSELYKKARERESNGIEKYRTDSWSWPLFNLKDSHPYGGIGIASGKPLLYQVGPIYDYAMRRLVYKEGDSLNEKYVRDDARLKAYLTGFADQAGSSGDYLTALTTFQVVFPDGVENPAVRQRIAEWTTTPEQDTAFQEQQVRFRGLVKEWNQRVLDPMKYPAF